jgi:hypothetical protein
MAGFEVIVRPVVFPNIRPAPPRALAPEDDPTKGLAVITGGGGTIVTTSIDWSVSLSRQLPQSEVSRQFDKERTYQKDDKGKINKANYIDVERLKKIKAAGSDDEEPLRVAFADPPKVDNVETLETDVTRDAGE